MFIKALLYFYLGVVVVCSSSASVISLGLFPVLY
jgi:hypothetical protein